MILFLPPLAEIDGVDYCTSDDGEVSGSAALDDTFLNRGCRYTESKCKSEAQGYVGMRPHLADCHAPEEGTWSE
jgi:hypothetical protein